MLKARMKLMGIMLVAGVLTGCGHHVKNANAPSPHVSHTGAAPSVSPSPTTTPSGTSTTTVTTTSSSVVVTSTTPNPSLDNSQSPPPPGAGSYSELRVTVNRVTPEGQVAGSSSRTYLVALTVSNPTSSMITVTLNTLTVWPGGQSPQYSENDRATAGLTSKDSLFPYPLTPAYPNSTQMNVFPGKNQTGDVTVEVPSASHYKVYWGQGSSLYQIATFTP